LVCEQVGIGAYRRMQGPAPEPTEARGVLMQTEHYMANMGQPERAERPGPERVDEVAGLERQQVAAALDLAAGRSAVARSDDAPSRTSGLGSAR